MKLRINILAEEIIRLVNAHRDSNFKTKQYTDAGNVEQVHIHAMVREKLGEQALETLEDMMAMASRDEHIEGIDSLVLVKKPQKEITLPDYDALAPGADPKKYTIRASVFCKVGEFTPPPDLQCCVTAATDMAALRIARDAWDEKFPRRTREMEISEIGADPRPDLFMRFGFVPTSGLRWDHPPRGGIYRVKRMFAPDKTHGAHFPQGEARVYIIIANTAIEAIYGVFNEESPADIMRVVATESHYIVGASPENLRDVLNQHGIKNYDYFFTGNRFRGQPSWRPWDMPSDTDGINHTAIFVDEYDRKSEEK